MYYTRDVVNRTAREEEELQLTACSSVVQCVL